MDTIYRDNILDHFQNPRHYGSLTKPHAYSEQENSLCGDRIGFGIKTSRKNGQKVIKKIKFSGEGCAISMASASMLSEYVLGKKIREIKKINKKIILKLLGIRVTPMRLKCAMLPLKTLKKTLTLVKDRKNSL